MSLSLYELTASFPPEDRERITLRHAELVHEVEGLRRLRQIAGKAQADVAAALQIKQPSISKIENQADMHLLTLRSYIAAVGGELELTVRLKKRRTVRIHALGDVTALKTPRKASLARARDLG